MRRITLLVIAVTLLAGTVTHAHHSYAATYDTSKQIKLEGKLVQFALKNPHAYVTIVAPDQKGAPQRWAAEWAAVAQLNTQGVKQDTLKVGDELTIVGNPSRVSGEFKVLLVNLKRPLDGFSWGTRTGERVE